MKKVEFNIGDKIVAIKDGELRKGKIKNFYPLNPPVFIIELEDGTVEKIPYSNVAPEPKNETLEEKSEPVEKSEITITPDEFTNIAGRVLFEETKGKPLVGVMIAPIIGKIRYALFVEPRENDNFFN